MAWVVTDGDGEEFVSRGRTPEGAMQAYADITRGILARGPAVCARDLGEVPTSFAELIGADSFAGRLVQLRGPADVVDDFRERL